MFGLWEALFKNINAKKANKELGKLIDKNPTYKENPLAGQQFGLAQNLFSGRMFGAPQQEKNILTNNANFTAQVGRNATDGSQALALAAAGQGQTDQAFENLQTKELQNKYGMLNNLNDAYANMIGEQDKVFGDEVRRFGDYANIKGAQMRNKASISENIFSGLNNDINDAASIFGIASGGGFGNLFKPKLKPNQNWLRP